MYVVLMVFLTCFLGFPWVQAEEASLKGGQGKSGEKQLITAEILYLEGFQFFSKGKFAEALPFFENAVKEDSDYWEAYLAIGECHYHLRHYEEAIEAFKQVIRIEPHYAEAHYGLRLTYLKTGDRGSALEEYKILKNLNSDFAEKLFNQISK
ncbi:MAG: tetratricopeptide repeat protein [Atribacterota bacterium]